MQNQPGSDLVLADCVRVWPNGSGPEESQRARMIRPASVQCFPADPDRMRIGSGMFTGIILDDICVALFSGVYKLTALDDILWCIQTHCALRHSLVYTNSLRLTTFSGVYKLTALYDILWCIQTHCALRHSLVYTNSLRFTTFSGVYKLTALYDILWCIQTHCALRHSLVYTNSLHFTTFSGVYKLTALYDILQHFLC